MKSIPLALATLLSAIAPHTSAADDLMPLNYNNDGLAVDLGVGLWAWPMPMDWDGDGDLDLLVSCPDYPTKATLFFENPGTASKAKLPVFLPGVPVGPAIPNARVSYDQGKPRVLSGGFEWLNFLGKKFEKKSNIHNQTKISNDKIRANQWNYVDFDGDGDLDITVGSGLWADYGWDNAFDAKGNWTRGPLHGYVHILTNEGDNEDPEYGKFQQLTIGASTGPQAVPVDVFGMPSPNFADFDGDGDLDLLCGEFLDGFTYFRNSGTRHIPVYDKGQQLKMADGQPLKMGLQMITPTAIDWDADGDTDLICGDEDGRVALIEHTGKNTDNGAPVFLPPHYFQQKAEHVKFGALVTPFGIDWDDDGDEDLICGNSAGHIGFIENLDGKPQPKWATPVLLKADGETIRIQAGSNGSIQGPAEAKWGYTTLCVADWDMDGLNDIMINSIWGKIEWFKNTGTKKAPALAKAQDVTVAWPDPENPPKPSWNWWKPSPGTLVTQWRTTPNIIDLDKDGLPDLVMLDQEGYLAFFHRQQEADGTLTLQPAKRVFLDKEGEPLRFNSDVAGRSGRRKICLTDWDGDGKTDILLNGQNAEFWKNISTADEKWIFENQGPIAKHRLAGHTTSPTTVDFNKNGKPEILIGAEDGKIYHQ